MAIIYITMLYSQKTILIDIIIFCRADHNTFGISRVIYRQRKHNESHVYSSA